MFCHLCGFEKWWNIGSCWIVFGLCFLLYSECWLLIKLKIDKCGVRLYHLVHLLGFSSRLVCVSLQSPNSCVLKCVLHFGAHVNYRRLSEECSASRCFR